MPFLSISNPRNRASLIAVLLLVEFMAILWLRDSTPREGAIQGSPYHESAPRYRQQDEIQHHRERRDAQGSYADSIRVIPHSGRKSDSKEERDTPTREDKVMHEQTSERHHHHRQGQQQEQRKEQDYQSDGTVKNEGVDKAARHVHMEDKRQLESSTFSSKAEGEQRTPSKTTTSTHNRSSSTATISAIPKGGKDGNKVTKPSTTPNTKTNKKTKTDKTNTKTKGAAKQDKKFKSTAERKMAQLIPALDEFGVIIEDHFISPRDTDGDGIPDFYVLLRPAANSKYMMDVGLFDDEIVVPPPAVLSSVIASVPTPAVVVVAAVQAPVAPMVSAAPVSSADPAPPIVSAV